MNIKIKKLLKNTITPTYSKQGDAGMDLTAISKNVINTDTHSYIEYGTGLAFEIPKGYVGLIFPRSSISNTGMIQTNSVSVIDSGYRGEVTCRFKWIPGTTDYNVGDRIGQLIIIPYPQVEFEEVEELSDTERGSSGYGSSGK